MTSQPPRVLLVEDDPVSRAFLGAAIQALPAAVDAADSMAAALALAAAGRYDLWLFDASLPDGSGSELLAKLRVRDASTPALAHTAAHDHEASRVAARGWFPASAVETDAGNGTAEVGASGAGARRRTVLPHRLMTDCRTGTTTSPRAP